MSRVWAFGCSHTLGTELGVSKYVDPDKWMLENAGTTNIWEVPDKHLGRVRNDWADLLDNLYKTTDLLQEEKHLSYAGKVAESLGYELCNHAIRGSGADRALHELSVVREKHIDWDNDIVFVGYTHIYRFMFDEERWDGNRNLNWMKTHKQKHLQQLHKMMLLDGPCDYFWSAANAGIYHMIKTMYPKVHMIDVVNTTNTYKPGVARKDLRFNTTTLDDYSKRTNNKKDIYPQGHFKEYTHELLATHLINKLGITLDE